MSISALSNFRGFNRRNGDHEMFRPIHMSAVVPKTKGKGKKRGTKNDNLIGPMDPKIDNLARERLITARVSLLIQHSFFGNLATRLKLINADDWCPTAATDGLRFYYNSRFIMKLKQQEVVFLVAHEVLHVAYDHMGRRMSRDPQIFNIANDYAVNADLKRHKVGQFITTVPCLYEQKYDGMASEEIYDDLMKNAKHISMDDLIDQMIDEHMDDADDGSGDGDGEEGKGRPRKLTEEERESIRQEVKQAVLAAAQSADAGTLPAGIERMVKDITEPKMPWREMIQTNLTSAIRSDYTWMKPSRRSWHMDAIMPGTLPGEEIDVDVAIDMSGSISSKQASNFLGEVGGMMEAFAGYKVTVFCFDTEVYNQQTFDSENMDSIDTYEPQGGGGTDFDAIFTHLKNEGRVPKRLIVFTDGYPCGSWGQEDYCDTTWIIHGDRNPHPPFGQFALYSDD